MTTFVVKHAGAGGESSALNTRNFRIETRTGTSGSWSTAVTVSGNTANITTSTVTARNARQIRLVITRSEQGSAAGAARIYEFEVYNGTPAAPAPAVLYAGQNATGRAQRFQAGAYDVLRGNLGLIGNDLARSLDVAPGYEATLCRDTGLTRLHDTRGRPLRHAARGLRPGGQLTEGESPLATRGSTRRI